MKINEKNTALGLLDKIDPWAFRISDDGETDQQYKTAFGISVVKNFPLIVDRFKSKIQYISDPFHQAYAKAVSKLGSVIDAEEIHECGTFISRSSPSETNTIFYDIKSEGKGEDFKINAVIFLFAKDTNSDKPSLAMYVQRNDKGYKSYLSAIAKKNGVDGMRFIADIFTLILFMKYCELETKIIAAKSKAIHINCKYVNESNQKIEVLDSTWFTTIVRSERFGVRGHFRMQPCGQAFSDRKLKWIDAFEKDGYTKKAKILNLTT